MCRQVALARQMAEDEKKLEASLAEMKEDLTKSHEIAMNAAHVEDMARLEAAVTAEREKAAERERIASQQAEQLLNSTRQALRDLEKRCVILMLRK